MKFKIFIVSFLFISLQSADIGVRKESRQTSIENVEPTLKNVKLVKESGEDFSNDEKLVREIFSTQILSKTNLEGIGAATRSVGGEKNLILISHFDCPLFKFKQVSTIILPKNFFKDQKDLDNYVENTKLRINNMLNHSREEALKIKENEHASSSRAAKTTYASDIKKSVTYTDSTSAILNEQAVRELTRRSNLAKTVLLDFNIDFYPGLLEEVASFELEGSKYRKIIKTKVSDSFKGTVKEVTDFAEATIKQIQNVLEKAKEEISLETKVNTNQELSRPAKTAPESTRLPKAKEKVAHPLSIRTVYTIGDLTRPDGQNGFEVRKKRDEELRRARKTQPLI